MVAANYSNSSGTVWKISTDSRMCYLLGGLSPLLPGALNTPTFTSLVSRVFSWMVMTKKSDSDLQNVGPQGIEFQLIYVQRMQQLLQPFEVDELLRTLKERLLPVIEKESPIKGIRDLIAGYERVGTAEAKISAIYLLTYFVQMSIHLNAGLLDECSTERHVQKFHQEIQKNLPNLQKSMPPPGDKYPIAASLKEVYDEKAAHSLAAERLLCPFTTAPFFVKNGDELRECLYQLATSSRREKFAVECREIAKLCIEGHIDDLKTHLRYPHDNVHLKFTTAKICYFLFNDEWCCGDLGFKCAVVPVDMLIQEGGVLDKLRKKGIIVQQIKDPAQIVQDAKNPYPECKPLPLNRRAMSSAELALKLCPYLNLRFEDPKSFEPHLERLQLQSASSSLVLSKHFTVVTDYEGYFWKIKKNRQTIGYIYGQSHITTKDQLVINPAIAKALDKCYGFGGEGNVKLQANTEDDFWQIYIQRLQQDVRDSGDPALIQSAQEVCLGFDGTLYALLEQEKFKPLFHNLETDTEMFLASYEPNSNTNPQPSNRSPTQLKEELENIRTSIKELREGKTSILSMDSSQLEMSYTRNENMSCRIAKILSSVVTKMKTQTRDKNLRPPIYHLFVMGVAHTLDINQDGKRYSGVPSLLEEKGYELKRVQYSEKAKK